MIRKLGRSLLTLLATCRDAIIVILVAALLGSLIGQLVRDSFSLLTPLMYLPPMPLAAMCLFVDALRRGRTLRGPRFSLAIVALTAAGVCLPDLIGIRSLDKADSSVPQVRLLQWNVQWGGHWDEASGWPRTGERIVREQPDLVVLSEAPADESHVRALADLLGPNWYIAEQTAHNHSIGYLSRMRLLSRFPATVQYDRHIPTAVATIVRIETDPPIRLMMADAVSGPGDKTSILQFFAEVIEQDGEIDIIAGDFNAVVQSRGFAAIRAAGYREATAHGFALRATWPTAYPVYAIDHVFVRAEHRLVGVHTFAGPSDHRGQVADLQLMR